VWIQQTSRRNRVPEHLQFTWERLEDLKAKDRQFKVFGASKHQYRSLRVSEREMSNFEAWCGLPLPSSYRDHLVHIGHGKGPYYGLWSPVLRFVPSFRVSISMQSGRQSRGKSPARPDRFHTRSPTLKWCDPDKIAGEKEPWITSTWPISGCIPICHQGCTYWTVLVVAGECAGRVWDIDDEGLWLPSRRPTGCLLTKAQLQPLPKIFCSPHL